MTPPLIAPIKAPAPWNCKATVYTVLLSTKKNQPLPKAAYDPLEAESYFASAAAGNTVTGNAPGCVMIVRYHQSPVGTYDELVILPGEMAYMDADGKVRQSMRVTRIYVSQIDTLYNGRANWNIPKHLARFVWTNDQKGNTSVKVFPSQADHFADEALPLPSTSTSQDRDSIPFFQATFKTIPYMPAFPSSTNMFKLIGVNPALTQPPLPAGNPSEIAAGTDTWCETKMTVGSWKTSVGWMDMQQQQQQQHHHHQDGLDDGPKTDEKPNNFWPGLGRWQLAARMDDATIVVPEGRRWDVDKKIV